jgi:hypothetical protein
MEVGTGNNINLHCRPSIAISYIYMEIKTHTSKMMDYFRRAS